RCPPRDRARGGRAARRGAAEGSRVSVGPDDRNRPDPSAEPAPDGPTQLVPNEKGDLVERLSAGTATLLLVWLIGIGAGTALLGVWLLVYLLSGTRLGLAALFGGPGLYTALTGASGPCVLWLAGRAPGSGPLRHLGSLRGHQVPAALWGRIVLLQGAKRRLAQEEVGVIGQAGQSRAWPRVGGEGKDLVRILTGAASLDPESPSAHVVLGLVGLEAEIPDLDRPFAVMLVEDKALVEEVDIACAEGQLRDLRHGAGRHDHQQSLLGHVDPRVAVAQCHQVQAMVGVHVADDDRVQLIRRVAAEQLGHRSGAGVEHDP